MFDKILKCRCCDNENKIRDWIALEVSSNDGHSRMSGRKWNENDNSWDYRGSIILYACPNCGTVKIDI